MGQNSVIDWQKQRFGVTGPGLFAGATMLAISVVAYTQLATESYVNVKHTEVTASMAKQAEANADTAEQVKALAEHQAKTNKRMGLVVRLVSAQYIAQVDEGEQPHHRARRSGGPPRPRSAKANRVAKALQIDPDDPLAGLELTEVLEGR